MQEAISITIASGVLCALLYIICGHKIRLWRKKSAFRKLLSVLASAMMIWIIGFVLGGGLTLFWPGYSEDSLLGLTPDQVIGRLGVPDGGDPRKFGWKDEDRDGALLFDYGWSWVGMIIEFKQNHVVHVMRNLK